MSNVKRILFGMMLSAIALTVMLMGSQPAQAGGMGGIAVRPARVCLNGVHLYGVATDPNALNRMMTAKIFKGHVGVPFPLVATGNSQTFTALSQSKSFTIHYPSNTFNVGDDVTYSVLTSDGSGYGGGQFDTVENCYLPIIIVPIKF